MRRENHLYRQSSSFFIAFFIFAVSTAAQTTAFNYQGRLTDAGNPANGDYQVQFKLFDAPAGGGQIGATISDVAITAANGVFSARIDFGANVFSGADRFVEIAVRHNSSESYTILSPRQQIASSPYAIRTLSAEQADVALNSQQLGGVTANQYVQTNDTRLSDDRNPLPNSPNYIQNTTSPQTKSNFNVSGDGTVGGTLTGDIVNAGSQFNLNGIRILSSFGGANLFVGTSADRDKLSNLGGANLFVGTGAGRDNTTGGLNAFFGTDAGLQNTTGSENAFFGAGAGFANTSGFDNAFFGKFAGSSNTTGGGNSFFGADAGFLNSIGGSNSFFGYYSGNSNTVGFRNSFFGALAGQANNTGWDNSFFGFNSGQANTSGSDNSFFGAVAGNNNNGSANSFFGKSAGFSNTTGSSNSFFGVQAGRDTTIGFYNSFFGRAAGIVNTIGESNSFFGFEAGKSNTTGNYNSLFGFWAGRNITTGSGNTFVGEDAGSFITNGSFNTLIGYDTNVGSSSFSYATAVGAGTIVTTNNQVQIGRITLDTVAIGALASASSLHVCITNLGVFASCSSSLRYKENIQNFNQGLSVIERFQPVTFKWKDRDEPDLGLIAEEVEEIAPLFIFRNQKGEIEGVKYAQLTVILINAVKEQQALIEQQQRQIEALRKLFCETNSQTEICQEKK